MSRHQPLGQVKLTSVSVIRLKKGGKRFELACYKNKISDYRDGLDTVDNILLTNQIFINVSKGQLANQKDLAVFKGSNEDIINEILTKGEVQFGEQERKGQTQQKEKDIVHYIATNTVNPTTNRPYSINMINKAIGRVQYNIRPHKPSKQQALDIIHHMQQDQILDIQRLDMCIRVHISLEQRLVVPEIRPLMQVTTESESSDIEIEGMIEPHQLNKIQEIITRNKAGRVEIINKDFK